MISKVTLGPSPSVYIYTGLSSAFVYAGLSLDFAAFDPSSLTVYFSGALNDYTYNGFPTFANTAGFLMQFTVDDSIAFPNACSSF